jgi:hypothetical protein
MRKFWVLSFLVGLVVGYVIAPSSTPATITLTTPMTGTAFKQGPVSYNLAAPMGICADQVMDTLTLTVYPVALQNVDGGQVTSITAGTISPVTFTINTAMQTWTSSNGQFGNLTDANLAMARGWLSAALTATVKNQAEQTLISLGILPGAQTPWQQ